MKQKIFIYLALLVVGLSIGLSICEQRAMQEMIYPNSTEAVIFNKWFNNECGNPWQYRVFNYYSIYSWVMLTRQPLMIANVKIIQIIVLLFMVYFYLKTSTCPWSWSWKIGAFKRTLLFAFVLFMASIRSNFAFDTYYDLIFYLVGFMLLGREKYWWIILLTIPAAANRESFGAFLLAAGVIGLYKRDRSLIVSAVISGIIFAVIYFGLRAIYPAQKMNVGFAGISYGWPMFLSNLRLSGIIYLTATYSFFAWWAFKNYRRWPAIHCISALVIIPVFLISTAFFGNIDETRLLLVPFTLYVLPFIEI